MSLHVDADITTQGAKVVSKRNVKKLRSTFEKENSMIGHRKIKESELKKKALYAIAEEPSLRRSKRRNALGAVSNAGTSKEDKTEIPKLRTKKTGAKTKLAEKSKKGGDDLQPTLSSSSLDSVKSVDVKSATETAESEAQQLDSTFIVADSLYIGSDSCSLDITWAGKKLAANSDSLSNPSTKTPAALPSKKKDIQLNSATEVQTTTAKSTLPQTITAKQVPSNVLDELSMVTAETASESFWKDLAEQRRMALEEALEENECLHDQLAVLEAENNRLRALVQQSEELAFIVKGILQ